MLYIYIYIYIYICIYIGMYIIYTYIYIYADEMKLEQLYKVGSESELKSWPDSTVGQSV